MSTVDLVAVPDAEKTTPLNRIPLQDTSLDIWDKKYRLKTKDGDNVDQSVSDTFHRVARALAETEKVKSEQILT